jgi:hypothetical protein
LGLFINALRPGAYTSMTKVDFAALDALPVKPVGIYGSASELVKYLKLIGAINDEM